MKKFYLNMIACAAAMLTAGAAQAGTLSMSIADISTKDAAITVTVDDVASYCFNIQPKYQYDANGGDEGAIEARFKQWEYYGEMYDSPWTDFIPLKYGTRTFMADDFITLDEGDDYVAYAFGINADGTVTAPLVSIPFRATDGPQPSFKLGTVTVTVSDVTANDALITVVPDGVDNYFLGVLEKETYDANGGDDGAIDARIKIWESYGVMYDSPWTDFIPTKNGEKTYRADDFVTLEVDVPYVAYAFGIDLDGTITSPVASVSFTPTESINNGIDAAEEVKVAVYPNPVATDLHVSTPCRAAMTMTDMSGRTVMQGALEAAENTLSVAGLPAGMYILRVEAADSSKAFKVVVRH